MNIVLNEPLSQISLLFVSAAMGLLAVALLMFAFQLAKLKDDPSESRFERYGFWVLAAGTLVLGIGVVLRGIAAQRVPWANMYEFAISGALMILTIYLISLRVKDVRYVAHDITRFKHAGINCRIDAHRDGNELCRAFLSIDDATSTYAHQ